MLMFETKIGTQASFLVVDRTKKPPKVCRLLQFARVTGCDFEVNIIETHPDNDKASILPLLSSKTYERLGLL